MTEARKKTKAAFKNTVCTEVCNSGSIDYSEGKDLGIKLFSGKYLQVCFVLVVYFAQSTSKLLHEMTLCR